jgi:hypothetical protein
MHESPDCHNTGQGKKRRYSDARARRCSRVQEEEGGDAEAAQEVRVVYNRWEVLVNVVEKLDAFSDSGLRSDAWCDLEGGSTTRLAQRGQGHV